ncbi:glycosyltransferase family 39 protein [Amaricoccus sp.]|uniref:ArnT family glycosyltransferase n=1 Tax=Amaricoccus sp. TaxID=1872485 RepID=UPI001B41BE4E|nr:glycosyltransferase family 39 protein [Amaricoccus sp.]MBP7002762.1 glycosyltransferase family 39 protein [Amaricoccus sp.]
MRAGRTWLAMAGFALVAAFGVLARPLLPVDETRYLAVAWEMRTSGDWLVPHLNGATYSHKPPLLFWLINLVWSVTGVSEIAARLIGPAFAVATIWATGRLARRLWPQDDGAGGRAAMILAGFGVFVAYAGLTMFDAMLALAVVLGVLALVAAGDTRRGWAAFGAALAFGGLAKGPVVLVHLLPIAVLAPLWKGLPLRRTAAGLALALGVGLALVGLWLVPAIVAGGPEYREAVLWTQSAGRMTDAFAHARPWWWFLALLPVVLWPWAWSPSLLRRIAALDLRADRGLRLAAVWAGSALALFSLMSGKQIHYLIPTLPAAALLMARAMGGDGVRALPAVLPPALLGLAFLGAAVGLVADERAARLLAPGWVMALVGLGCLGLSALGTRLRGPALAFLGLGLVAALDLAFLFGAPGRIYDAGEIAGLIAPSDAAGVGVLGDSYDGMFTFAARLRNPVTALDRKEAAGWLAENPDRVLVTRLDRDHTDDPPRAVVVYRNRPYGVWGGSPAPDAGDGR